MPYRINVSKMIAGSLIVLTITACQTHEYARVGISETQRDADSKKCFAEAREAIKTGTPPPGATSDQMIATSAISGYQRGKAMGEYHSQCMAKLGYERVKIN